MNNTDKKFVVILKDIVGANGVLVEKNDIGMIMDEGKDTSTIFCVRIWQNVDLKNNEFKQFEVKKTGDAFKSKICNVCHKLLETTTYFKRNQNGINNRIVRRPSCKDCRKLMDGKEADYRIVREWLKKKPEIEPFECPICLKRTIAGVTSKLVLDHNHITGDVRAWICDSCNTGIGRFKDDVQVLKRAIAFLESKEVEPKTPESTV